MLFKPTQQRIRGTAKRNVFYLGKINMHLVVSFWEINTSKIAASLDPSLRL